MVRVKHSPFGIISAIESLLSVAGCANSHSRPGPPPDDAVDLRPHVTLHEDVYRVLVEVGYLNVPEYNEDFAITLTSRDGAQLPARPESLAGVLVGSIGRQGTYSCDFERTVPPHAVATLRIQVAPHVSTWKVSHRSGSDTFRLSRPKRSRIPGAPTIFTGPD